ncbi:universal stress protein [Streptomyces sp. NPDC057877]|uniref:universal stress protein n=1 Tax=Streptomyces sp. NPDC057877 TaxID=3346269 RepID=UPI0036CB269E
MPRIVTVGLDGSAESRAAAEWAAREAKLRGLPLKLVQVWEPVPDPIAQAALLNAATHRHWSERIPREAAAGIRRRHPGLEVGAEQLTGRPYEVLPRLAEDTELLVLGSRGLSGVGGFLVGSVGMMVVAHAQRPVVLVRSGEQAADEHVRDLAGNPSEATPFRPVVLGLDTAAPDPSVLEFAFEAAARRSAPLRVVNGWSLPPSYVHDIPSDAAEKVTRRRAEALTEVLHPWRAKFPEVTTVAESRPGKAADVLVEAARDASLVVVGRRIRRSPLGAHIGPVTHAVLHHATVPVAVVAHH